MSDEQTKKTDTEGKPVTPVVPEGGKPDTETSTPLEDSDAVYKRLKEKNNKIQEELIRGEKLRTESLLGGEGGGNIPGVELSAEEIKKKKAAEFFKDTALGDAIDKTK